MCATLPHELKKKPFFTCHVSKTKHLKVFCISSMKSYAEKKLVLSTLPQPYEDVKVKSVFKSSSHLNG